MSRDYDLKMSKIGRWSTEDGGYCHDVIGIPLNTCSGAILFSIASIIDILGTQPQYICREVF